MQSRGDQRPGQPRVELPQLGDQRIEPKRPDGVRNAIAERGEQVRSDDPPLFNTDLVQEYQVLVEHLGFSAVELEGLSLNALRASFLPDEEKEAMEEGFDTEFARLRTKCSLDGVAG